MWILLRNSFLLIVLYLVTMSFGGPLATKIAFILLFGFLTVVSIVKYFARRAARRQNK
jgi:hypothetical protein